MQLLEINQSEIRASGLQLPGGEFAIDRPIELADCDAVTIAGALKTRIVYFGPPTPGVVQFKRTYRCRAVDFEIVVGSEGVDAGVLLTNLPGSNRLTGRVSSACEITNVRVMHGGHPTAARRAFAVDSYAGGAGDGNNDMHDFDRCTAQSYREAGFYVNGSQCHQLGFRRCSAHDAGGRRPIGWHFAEGVFFHAEHCGATNNSIDFLLGRMETQQVITGFNSEHSNQFLVTGRSGSETYLNVSNTRWDGEPILGKPVVDGFGGGPFTFTNCKFAGINGVCPTMRFDNYWNNATEKSKLGSLDLSGVSIWQHGGAQFHPADLLEYPPTFELRRHGVSYIRINPNGSRSRVAMF